MPLYRAELQPKKIVQPSALIHDVSQVLYLPFDWDDGSYARDRSGYRNHGTIYGAARAGGKIGMAIRTDGVDDYVKVPHSSELTWSTEDFTVSFWLYFISRSEWYATFLKKQTWGTSGWGVCSEYDAAGISFVNGAVKAKYYMSTPSADLKNKWVHLAFVREGSNWIWYLDGAVDNSGSLVDFKKGTEDLHIMGDPLVPRWIEGFIDEPRFFNRPLSRDEIRMLMYRRF